MGVTSWTDERATALFRRYRDRYWPGRLRGYAVAVRPVHEIADALGFCDTEKRVVVVDVARHGSDGAVRSTLLHEMCHAAAGQGGLPHGSRFFAQLEHLLTEGAPIRIGLAENPGHVALESVPEKFVRCRARLAGAYRRQYAGRGQAWRRRRPVEADREAVAWKLREIARNTDSTWREALELVGRQYGLLDVDGKLLDTYRGEVRAYRRAYEEERSIRQQIEAGKQLWERKRAARAAARKVDPPG